MKIIRFHIYLCTYNTYLHLISFHILPRYQINNLKLNPASCLPMKTNPKLTRSTLKMGSLMNHRAKNTVHMGEVAEIMVASAMGKCQKQKQHQGPHDIFFFLAYRYALNMLCILQTDEILNSISEFLKDLVFNVQVGSNT